MNETDPLYSSIIVNSVFNAFSSYTAIMLNILVIHALRKTSSLPKPLKILLLSLAASDLGVGLLVQPLYIAALSLRLKRRTNSIHIPFNVAQLIFTLASFFSVVAISVDRFLAVHLHLRYLELVTHKRVITGVMSIWTFSVFYPVITFVWNSKRSVFEVIVLIIFGVCFIITAIVNCRIHFTVRNHADQIEVLRIQVAQNSQVENAARQRKSAVNTMYIYFLLTVCFLPLYCATVTRLISPQSSVLNVMPFYAFTLLFLNSSLNPVIYCWKLRHIRLAIIETLRNIFRR